MRLLISKKGIRASRLGTPGSSSHQAPSEGRSFPAWLGLGSPTFRQKRQWRADSSQLKNLVWAAR